MQYIINGFGFGITILATILCFSCNNNTQAGKQEKANQDTSQLKKQLLVFDKLLGTWINEDGKSFERWSQNENGSYKSVVFRVKEADTIYTEEVIVYHQNGKWISKNKEFGQNDEKAVQFTVSLLTDSSVQFSNPEHDFPTDIQYTIIHSNRVNAFIAGPNKKGGKDTIPFTYTRVN